MIGLVLVAHGGLAREYLAAAEHVVGHQDNAVAVAIAPDEDLRSKQAEVCEAVETVNRGAGVVIITDMFGGTPSNMAMGACREGEVEVIYGTNLPLLVKFAQVRHLPLAEAVELALRAGHKYMNSAGAILAKGRVDAVAL